MVVVKEVVEEAVEKEEVMVAVGKVVDKVAVMAAVGTEGALVEEMEARAVVEKRGRRRRAMGKGGDGGGGDGGGDRRW